MVPVKIGIIGYGIVGEALAYGFRETSGGKDQILFYDKYKESRPLEEVVDRSDFIFIALPTPMKKDESGIDLSIIEESIAQITPLTNQTDKIIVIKSTVVPGTTANFEQKYPKSRFAFNPEFLTEANYLKDFLNAERTVIGASSNLTSRKLAAVFLERFPESQIFQTDPTSAEMVKLTANALMANKVTMANIFYDLCESLGIKWDEVKKMAAADKRIGLSCMEVTSLRGWGGKCFPKDWVNLMGQYKSMGLDYSVLETIWEYNKQVRKVHDWEEIPFAVSDNQQEEEVGPLPRNVEN